MAKVMLKDDALPELDYAKIDIGRGNFLPVGRRIPVKVDNKLLDLFDLDLFIVELDDGTILKKKTLKEKPLDEKPNVVKKSKSKFKIF